MAQLRALVWKDLRLHGGTSGLLLAGWPVAVRVLLSIPPASPAVAEAQRPVVTFAASLLLFAAVSTGIASTLVARERTADTFAWLRALPVSDAHIVAGKCVTGLVLHAFGFAVWWAVLGRLIAPLTLPQAVTVWWATAVVWSLTLALQLASPGPAAAAAPLALLAAGWLTGPALSRWPAARAHLAEAWDRSWHHTPLWLACLAICALLFVLAWWRFHEDDASTLVE